MYRRLSLACLLAAAACCEQHPEDTATQDPGLCAATKNPTLELAQYGEYGELTDGVDILFGHPPQGGAPYAPFSLRVAGLEMDDSGLDVTLDAIDADSGEVLGSGEYIQRFICSNVGDNSGTLVGADLHMRFFGWELDDLDGRHAEVTIQAVNAADDWVSATFEGVLVRED